MVSTPSGLVWVVVGLAFEAKIARMQRDVMVHVGVGEALITPAFENDLSRATAVISFGTAGGLDPTLPPGTIVLATHILSENDAVPALPAMDTMDTDQAWCARLQQALPEARVGRLFSAAAPVVHCADKAALFAQTGALAVDMESGHLARMAYRYKVPFAACRVVIDRATQTLPPAALAGMQPDGSTRIAPILRSLIRDPSQLPALCQLGSDAAKARRAMARVAASALPRFAFDLSSPVV